MLKDKKKTIEVMRELYLQRKIKQLQMPIVQDNGFWLAKDLQGTDIDELGGKEVLSKDFMHGFVAPEMMPYLQTDLDLLSMDEALAKADKSLKAFYQTLVYRTIAEYRASVSTNGLGRRITGSPLGQPFETPQHGYIRPEEEEQQNKGGMFDFLKGKKVMGSSGASTATSNTQNPNRW
jgi:hypothetical protein